MTGVAPELEQRYFPDATIGFSGDSDGARSVLNEAHLILRVISIRPAPSAWLYDEDGVLRMTCP